MHPLEFALAVIEWTPFASCVIVALLQPRSWPRMAQGLHLAVWALMGWLLVVAHVGLAQHVAAVNASTDEDLLDLYSSDGAARAFASLFGWSWPLAGLMVGLALRTLSGRLLRLRDRQKDSRRGTQPSPGD